MDFDGTDLMWMGFLALPAADGKSMEYERAFMLAKDWGFKQKAQFSANGGQCTLTTVGLEFPVNEVVVFNFADFCEQLVLSAARCGRQQARKQVRDVLTRND